MQLAEARILEKNAKVVAATPNKRFCNGPKCTLKLKPLRITKVAQKNNEVTDINAWRDRIGYVPGAFDVEQSRAIVPNVPTSYGLFRLSYTTVARVGAPVLGVYGTQPPEYKWVPGRFIVLHGASGQRLHTFDLEALLKPANTEAGAGNFVRPSSTPSTIRNRLCSHRTCDLCIEHGGVERNLGGHSRGNGRGGLAEPAACCECRPILSGR